MTRGKKILRALITEIGKRADLVRMWHLHHSPDFASPTPWLGRQDETEEDCGQVMEIVGRAVLKADNVNEHDAADIVCDEECKPVIATLHVRSTDARHP